MSDRGHDSENLEDSEKRQAAEHEPLRPMVIHEIIRAEGQAELERPAGALVWSGLAAGLSMGFSFLAEALLRAGLPDAPWRHLIASAGYCVGFIIVILGRQQLFTESTLTAALPVMSRPSRRGLLSLARVWAVVFAANIAGTWLYAFALTLPGLSSAQTRTAMADLATEALAPPFWDMMLRAVFAGWLIALMVWLLPSAKTAKLLVIGLLTYMVALGRFSHIIAGSTEAAYAVIARHAAPAAYFAGFLVPTVVGNTLGGVVLAAMLNHAPLRTEGVGEEES
jgi:formate/nitrite transporter FocA (FNT family)